MQRFHSPIPTRIQSAYSPLDFSGRFHIHHLNVIKRRMVGFWCIISQSERFRDQQAIVLVSWFTCILESLHYNRNRRFPPVFMNVFLNFFSSRVIFHQKCCTETHNLRVQCHYSPALAVCKTSKGTRIAQTRTLMPQCLKWRADKLVMWFIAI